MNLYWTVCVGILETLKTRIKIESDFDLLCQEFYKLANIDAIQFIQINNFEFLIDHFNNIKCSNANPNSWEGLNTFRSLCGVYVVDDKNELQCFKSESSKFDIFIKLSGNDKFILFPKQELMNTIRYFI